MIVRTLLTAYTSGAFECRTFGSECNGAFAQYAKAASTEVYAMNAPRWTDVELGSMPCAFSTAENMCHRAGVSPGEAVVVTGAGGGVGAATVQLCKKRSARAIAVASREKREYLLSLGADEVIPRGESIVGKAGKLAVEVVLDVVAGPAFPELLDVLKKGGRYATAGAIAGPMVELDVRALYLKGLSLFGCTYQAEEVFANLVGYIEREEIKPQVGQGFTLKDIKRAQEVFQEKTSSGKLVLEID